MYRTFEDVGVSINGVAYGHFSGEVQFEPDGAASIDIERNQSAGPPLHLDLDELLAAAQEARRRHAGRLPA